MFAPKRSLFRPVVVLDRAQAHRLLKDALVVGIAVDAEERGTPQSSTAPSVTVTLTRCIGSSASFRAFSNRARRAESSTRTPVGFCHVATPRRMAYALPCALADSLRPPLDRA